MKIEPKHLTPPLCPPASHAEVPFIVGTPPVRLPDQKVAAIAAALFNLLPREDLAVASDGRMIVEESSASPWQMVARLEATSRSSR